MIARLLRGGTMLLVYACVATILAEVILATYLATTWRLDRERVVQILAIAYGIDLLGMKEEADKRQEQPASEQVSYEQILETRAKNFRNLELRERALQDGLRELQAAQQKLAGEEKRLQRLKDDFEKQLETVKETAGSTGIEEARRILEAAKPAQAKLLLVKWLDDKEIDKVVAVLNGMPDAKRAKIVAEFKTREDAEKIGEVIRRIRDGLPAAAAAEQAQQQLSPAKPAGA